MKVALGEGTELNQYVIRKVLGTGGFGITYLAWDSGLEKHVAIKEYFPSDFGYRDGNEIHALNNSIDDFHWGKARFVDEARVLARFKHPNIVGVVQIFESNNTAYIVLEYEKGRSLKTWLAEIGGPPSQVELDLLLAPILDALDLIHSNNVLHRDLAPDNIYIRDDGSPVLIDFGSAREAIAARTKLVSAVVKAGYSPVEQYSTRGVGQGPWTDIYSLAATLYVAISGVAPSESTERLLNDDQASIIVAAAISGKEKFRPDFLAAIDWALKIAPKDRPQSISQWRAALFGTKATLSSLKIKNETEAPNPKSILDIISRNQSDSEKVLSGVLLSNRGANPRYSNNKLKHWLTLFGLVGILLAVSMAIIIQKNENIGTPTIARKGENTTVLRPRMSSSPSMAYVSPTTVQEANERTESRFQRAALLIQSPTSSNSRAFATFVGTVVWTLETVDGPAGKPAQLMVRAAIDIPDAHVKASMLLEKNNDAVLPASHTIELRFAADPGSIIGDVKQVDTLQMRKEEYLAGDALSGVATTITANYFLIGLTKGDPAEAHNIALMQGAGWFDVPMLLTNGKIAKITIEKGLAARGFWRRLFRSGQMGALNPKVSLTSSTLTPRDGSGEKLGSTGTTIVRDNGTSSVKEETRQLNATSSLPLLLMPNVYFTSSLAAQSASYKALVFGRISHA